MNTEMENWKNHQSEIASYLVNMAYPENQLCFVCGNERAVVRCQDCHTFFCPCRDKITHSELPLHCRSTYIEGYEQPLSHMDVLDDDLKLNYSGIMN